jgi:hypothetical protein
MMLSSARRWCAARRAVCYQSFGHTKLDGQPGQTWANGNADVAEFMRPPIRLGERRLFTMKPGDFTYSHLLPKKRPILLCEVMLTKPCRRCGAIYTTKSRTKKRCDACQVIAAHERQQKATDHVKAQRAVRRALPRG